MKKFITPLLLSLIVVLAFTLRLYQVTLVPPSLNWDEVAMGYNAYSIFKTGSDEWGQFLPTHFKSYGEYKLPMQVYFSIPAIALFGLNDFAVRLTPVIYGTLTILVLFFLSRKLFKNNLIALSSALFLAISPWHIQLTRASFESSFSVFWVLIGFWMFVKGLENLNSKKINLWIILSIIFFSISIYTYNSARVFSPLYLLFLGLFYRNEIKNNLKTAVMSLVLFLILMIPLILFVIQTGGNSRYKLVSITDEAGLIPRIEQNRNNSNLPPIFNNLIHNRYTYVSLYFMENYLSHFNPQFLFLNGASHKQHHVQGVGEMYAFQFPLVLAGLYFLIKKYRAYRVPLISWILIAFIPVSVTNDSIPNALRTLIAAPIFQIICSLGLIEGYEVLKSKTNQKMVFIAGSITLVIIFVSIFSYLYNYYNVYPKLYSRDWQYGYKEVIDFVKEHSNEYDQIVITNAYGQPYMFTLFYLSFDPAKFQMDPNLVRFETKDWVSVLKFDKYYFPDLTSDGTKYVDLIKTDKDKRTLFVGKPGDFPKDTNPLKTVFFLNGDPAFLITNQK